MGLPSNARANSAATHAAFHLRAAVEARPIAEQVRVWEEAQASGRYTARPNIEVIGTCGHRIDVLSPHRYSDTVRAKIDAGTYRRRCQSCPKTS